MVLMAFALTHTLGSRKTFPQSFSERKTRGGQGGIHALEASTKALATVSSPRPILTQACGFVR